MRTLHVTAAIIEYDHQILITQRKEGTHMALRWEFPGGKIEPGESPEECLKREIKEELDLDILIKQKLLVVEHQYEEMKVILHCYMCSVVGGVPKKKGCKDFRWVSPSELTIFSFAEADYPVVNYLIKKSEKAQHNL